MTNAELKTWLTEHLACQPAMDWLGDRDLATAWAECPEPAWMIWLLDERSVDPNRMRMLSCRQVRETPLHDGRTVWDMLTDPRSRTVVYVAERYARGDATDKELTDADDAAWETVLVAAQAADRAAARAAAWAASRYADRAAVWSASWAVSCTALAASGNVLASKYCADDAAADDESARLAQCRIIREMFPVEEVMR
jgi:hypothetical protein